MADVQAISITTVRAENKNVSNPKIELTPWDLQLLLVGPIQKGLLYQKLPPPYRKTFISRLKASLSRTLNIFPPLAGRLATTINDDGATLSYHIDCNNAGAEFVHAHAGVVAVADILEPIYVPSIVHSFFPLNGVRNFEGTSRPLMAVQVTELVDGVFIGCTINHMVADGTSFWHFFNTWSEVSRGFEQVSKLPVLHRWFYGETDHPIRISISSDKQQYSLPSLKERVFHFTKENIAILKERANSEMSTSKISSLQALLSHLWRSVIRNSNLDLAEEVHYRLLVGARPRLRSEVPENYFGNAVQVASLTLKVGDLLEQGLGYTALKMNEVVAMHTVEKLKSLLKSWVENPKLVTMGEIVGNALVTSSSPWFDVYGNDFGWGRPVAVRSGAGNKHDGKITVFCGVEEGSIDIEASLSPETLEALGNDAEFMDAVTVKSS